MKSIDEMNAELRAAVEARLAVSEAKSAANTALKSALDFRGDRPKTSQWIHPHEKPSGSGFYWVMVPKSSRPQLAYYLGMTGAWRDAYVSNLSLEPSCWTPLTAPVAPGDTAMPMIRVGPDTIAVARQAREMMVELAIDIAAGRKPHPGGFEFNSLACYAADAWHGQPQTLDGGWVAEKLRGFYAVSAVVGDGDVTVVYRHNSLPHQRVGDMDVTYIDPSGSEPIAIALIDAGEKDTLDDFDNPKGPFHIEITWKPKA